MEGGMARWRMGSEPERAATRLPSLLVAQLSSSTATWRPLGGLSYQLLLSAHGQLLNTKVSTWAACSGCRQR